MPINLIYAEKTYLFGCVYDYLAINWFKVEKIYLLRSRGLLGRLALRKTNDYKRSDCRLSKLKTGC